MSVDPLEHKDFAQWREMERGGLRAGVFGQQKRADLAVDPWWVVRRLGLYSSCPSWRRSQRSFMRSMNPPPARVLPDDGDVRGSPSSLGDCGVPDRGEDNASRAPPRITMNPTIPTSGCLMTMPVTMATMPTRAISAPSAMRR